ncbi:hypothetical protein RHMOL_Rhmol10G0013600 [Rhododendron molle]|uniref:Uncharacterized protein n=1 Tax=Rhododendron molle TaxID=49168 RepID=A0ACC0LXU7_RHOML|nr:hypothetical protein RHMOL_Rhmol10G0013600 [Rhododendron molle]
MADQPSNKRLKSTFSTHHNAPIWIIEEDESPKSEEKTPEGEKLYKWVGQVTEPNQWESTERHPGWKFHISPVDGPNMLPDKITVVHEENDENFCLMPPIKYFDECGDPVYYFADPVTGHKYWDECNCDGCYEDYLLDNEGISPHRLQEQHAEGEKAKAHKGKQKLDEVGPPSIPINPTHPIP